MKKALVLIALIAVASAIFFWQEGREGPAGLEEKPRVVVTTFALYDAARYIGGDRIAVQNLLPPGADLHSFEPTPKTMVHLEEAALLIYGGAGLEPWSATLTKGVASLDMSAHVRLRGEACDHEAHAGHEHHGHEEGADPHYWLDIENMQHVAETIAEAFGRLDKRHADEYKERAARYAQQLQLLADDYSRRLAQCERRVIVVNHNAFGYLAERYGFEVHAISGLSGDAMPSAKTMAELTELIRGEGVTTVFFESFASDRLARTLAAESGAAVDMLHPLANVTTEQAQEGVGYDALMRINLDKLAKAMVCR